MLEDQNKEDELPFIIVDMYGNVVLEHYSPTTPEEKTTELIEELKKSIKQILQTLIFLEAEVEDLKNSKSDRILNTLLTDSQYSERLHKFLKEEIKDIMEDYNG